MSAPTIERPPAPPGPVHPSRTARWGRIVAIVVLLVLVIAGVAGVVLARYQPLVSDVLGHTNTTYREGAPFSYAFDLVNRGRFPVTVTSIDPPSGLGLIAIDDVLVSKTGAAIAGDTTARSYEPFHSFTLGPGAMRGILVRGRFAGCTNFARQSGPTYMAQGSTFRVYGVPRATSIPIVPFSIMAPTTCPGRP